MRAGPYILKYIFVSIILNSLLVPAQTKYQQIQTISVDNNSASSFVGIVPDKFLVKITSLLESKINKLLLENGRLDFG